MPSTPCRQPGCPTLVKGGYCDNHRRKVEQRFRERGHRSLYGTKRWKIRSRHYLRNHSLCVKCGRLATDVDHIVPVEDGGDMWDERNWQALCHSCHSRKTNDDVRNRTYH